jgi:DNA-binding response OmpR family regulator
MAASPPPFRVLLVDDEPVIRELVQAMLEGDGVEVRCMDSGTRALAEARAYRPDLVLLDVVMPGLDGLAVLRLLKSDAALAETQVHMLTARSKAADHAAAEKAGADGYIEKPFKGGALQALVASLRARARR